jgi:alpha-tubulin suppressor-like RCC1 family protein
MDFMPIENASDCAQLACGEAHIAVIKTDGTLWGYGESGYGQLAGIGTKKKLVPMDKGQWIQVSCGKWHTVALKADGTLWGVGCNYHSQIGRIEGPGGLGDRTTLTQIEKDNDWVQVACGSNHTLAIKSDGTMWGVGLVDPVRTGCLKTFTQLGASRDWLRVACRHSRIVEYRKDGTVKLDGRILSDEIPGGISQVALCLTSAAVLNSQGNLYVYPMYKFDNHE